MYLGWCVGADQVQPRTEVQRDPLAPGPCALHCWYPAYQSGSRGFRGNDGIKGVARKSAAQQGLADLGDCVEWCGLVDALHLLECSTARARSNIHAISGCGQRRAQGHVRVSSLHAARDLAARDLAARGYQTSTHAYKQGCKHARTDAQTGKCTGRQTDKRTNGQTDRHRHRHRQAPIGKIVGDELQSLPLGPVSPAIDRLLARVQAAAAARSARRGGGGQDVTCPCRNVLPRFCPQQTRLLSPSNSSSEAAAVLPV